VIIVVGNISAIVESEDNMDNLVIMSIKEKNGVDLTENELDEIIEIVRNAIAESKYADKVE